MENWLRIDTFTPCPDETRLLTAKYMSIAVFRSDYVTKCAALTSVRLERKLTRNRQLHIFPNVSGHSKKTAYR